MKHKFEAPEMEVVTFGVEDVVTTSYTPGENETGIDWDN